MSERRTGLNDARATAASSVAPEAKQTFMARTDDNEISNLIVPNGTPGYGISPPMHKLGWHASDTRELSFAECAVPEGNLLGERGSGFRQFLTILDGGRISGASGPPRKGGHASPARGRRARWRGPGAAVPAPPSTAWSR